MADLSSPFAQPAPGLRIRDGAPPLSKPTKAEIESFPAEARDLLRTTWADQSPRLANREYNLDWLADRHVLIAGGTGPGLGGAFASAILGLGTAASLTVVARDLSRSLNFETGRVMESRAEELGWLGTRFNWLNDGLALEGPPLEKLLAGLRAVGANRVVYFNTVAAALSGLQPGMPPVYVKDSDDEGLFQWRLRELNERELETTRFVMGEMAVKFPAVLEANGIGVEATVFADWRGSLDLASRDPGSRTYGRHGAYSTSLYLPKEHLQAAAREAFGTSRKVLDIFYPMMRTRALPLIPGGMAIAAVNEKLMAKEGIRRLDVPELALKGLDFTGRALLDGYDNPFPRADDHDSHLDDWLFEVVARLNDDENSDFYFRRWL